MKRILLLVLLLALPACASHAPSLSGPGIVAYSADQIVLRVNELENAAIQANAGGGLPVDVTRTIVQFTVSADKVLKTTPAGWQATVAISWAEAKKKIPLAVNPAVQAAISAVDVVLATIGGAK